MWGDSSVEQNEKKSISPMLSVSKSGSVTLQRERVMSGDNSTSTESGWWGAISKTTDGGATWSTVFHSEPTDVYYFNAISCSSETHCVAVAEGMCGLGSYFPDRKPDSLLIPPRGRISCLCNL